MRGGVCVAPSAGVRRCPVWLWRRPPRTPAAVSSLLSVACRPPPAASSHERARPRCSLLSSRLVLSAATVHSMESPAASPPASLPQTKGRRSRPTARPEPYSVRARPGHWTLFRVGHGHRHSSPGLNPAQTRDLTGPHWNPDLRPWDYTQAGPHSLPRSKSGASTVSSMFRLPGCMHPGPNRDFTDPC